MVSYLLNYKNDKHTVSELIHCTQNWWWCSLMLFVNVYKWYYNDKQWILESLYTVHEIRRIYV